MTPAQFREVLKLAEEVGATRYLQTPSFGSIAAGDDSTPQPIRFTRAGFVTAYSGQIASAAVADYGGTSLRVNIGGTEDLYVDGQGGPTFAGFLELFGGVPARRKLVRRVVPGDVWVFTVRNGNAGAVTPLVLLDVLDDEDVKKLLTAI
jgi:hypothetical protein